MKMKKQHQLLLITPLRLITMQMKTPVALISMKNIKEVMIIKMKTFCQIMVRYLLKNSLHRLNQDVNLNQDYVKSLVTQNLYILLNKKISKET